METIPGDSLSLALDIPSYLNAEQVMLYARLIEKASLQIAKCKPGDTLRVTMDIASGDLSVYIKPTVLRTDVTPFVITDYAEYKTAEDVMREAYFVVPVSVGGFDDPELTPERKAEYRLVECYKTRAWPAWPVGRS